MAKSFVDQVIEKAYSKETRQEGSLLQDMYESGAKAKNCTALRSELAKLSRDPVSLAAAFLSMREKNQQRRGEDPSLPELTIKLVPSNAIQYHWDCGEKPDQK